MNRINRNNNRIFQENDYSQGNAGDFSLTNVRKLSALVVDDEQTVRKVLYDYLSRIGFEITLAEIGSTAVQLAETQQFDIYFIDLMLPGIDGIAVMKEVLKRNQDAYIIIMTGYSTVENAVKSLKAGAYDFITKPFDFQILEKITERIIERERLIMERDYFLLQSIRDGLTHLYNRKYILNVLQKEFDRAARYALCLSVMMIDLDDFKNINDTFGHSFGDMVLAQLAEVLSNSVRSSDICGRYGGEEFIVVLPETIPEDAIISADRLKTGISECIHIPAGCSPLTISVGISGFPFHGECAEDLIINADTAMYKVKNKGKNAVRVFNPEQDAEYFSCDSSIS